MAHRLLSILVMTLAHTAWVVAADLPLGHADFLPTPERPIGWRGDGTGRYPGATPITDWDLKTGRNVVWKTKVPFYSASGPIVVGDKVFTTAEPDLVICVDATTGKELWRRHNAIHLEEFSADIRAQAYAACEEILSASDTWISAPHEFEGTYTGRLELSWLWWEASEKRPDISERNHRIAQSLGIDSARIQALYKTIGIYSKETPELLGHYRKALLAIKYPGWSGNMSATPASDGSRIIIKAAAPGPANWTYLVCYDLDGKRLWQVDLGRDGSQQWGMAYDSPMIINHMVITQIRCHPVTDDKGKAQQASGLAAYDIATGKQLWSVPAPLTCSTPIRLTIDGIPLIHYASKIYLPETGVMVGDLLPYIGYDVDTPVVDGDLYFSRGAEGLHFKTNERQSKKRACVSAILRLKWETRGEKIVYEPLWNGPHNTFWDNNWRRSSTMMADGWLMATRAFRPAIPSISVVNTRDGARHDIKLDEALRFHPKDYKNERIPGEDLMSIVRGGNYLFACPSNWPSQFVVVSAPPELKTVGAPIMDAPVVGSPYFQGNRMYVRDYRNLYCFATK